MATKLKKMQLNSVDLVRAGANQEADICLYKSAEESAQDPTEQETNIFKQFINWLRGNNHTAPEEPTDPIEKEYITFDQINNNREAFDNLWRYTDALTCSIRSIMDDKDLDRDGKASMMLTSLRQFSDAMEGLIGDLAGMQKEEDVVKSEPDYDEIEEVSGR